MDLKDFKDRIWWTRKNRIHAEKRLLAQAQFSQYLLVWYSFVSVCAAIYVLAAGASFCFELILVYMSIGILILSLVINNSKFYERAMEMKQNHELINNIHLKLDDDSLDKAIDEYSDLMKQIENHLDIDYISALVTEYNNTPEDKRAEKLSKQPTKKQILHYYFLHFFIFLRRAVLYLAPLSLIFFV